MGCLNALYIVFFVIGIFSCCGSGSEGALLASQASLAAPVSTQDLEVPEVDKASCATPSNQSALGAPWLRHTKEASFCRQNASVDLRVQLPQLQCAGMVRKMRKALYANSMANPKVSKQAAPARDCQQGQREAEGSSSQLRDYADSSRRDLQRRHCKSAWN